MTTNAELVRDLGRLLLLTLPDSERTREAAHRCRAMADAAWKAGWRPTTDESFDGFPDEHFSIKDRRSRR